MSLSDKEYYEIISDNIAAVTDNVTSVCENLASQLVTTTADTPDTPAKRRYTGVGVLVLTEVNGRPYVLLGRERFKSLVYAGDYVIPMYEEFGGGIQKKSISLEENALLELDEETCHMFNFSSADILNSADYKYIDIPFREDRMYRMYIIYIPNLDVKMNIFYNNYNIISNSQSNYYKKRNYLEMDNISLISLDEITYRMQTPDDNVFNFVNHKVLCVNDDVFISRRLLKLFDGYYVKSTAENYNNILDFKSTSANMTTSLMANMNGYIFKDDSYDYNGNSNSNNNNSAIIRGIDICYEIFNSCYIKELFEPNKIINLSFQNSNVYSENYANNESNFNNSNNNSNNRKIKYNFLIGTSYFDCC